MKKLNRIVIPGLILALMCVFFSACGGSSTFSVSIIDSLGCDIAEMYMVASESDGWGESLISDVFVHDSEVQILTLDKTRDSVYDMKVMDTCGDYYYFFNLPLSETASVELFTNAEELYAIVTPQKGDPITISGDFKFGDNHEDTIASPTPNDPLDNNAAIPGFESLSIPFPSTMQVAKSNSDNRFIQLEAVNDPDNNNGISFNIIELGGTYEERLNSSSTAQEALVEIVGKVCEQTFPGMLINSIGTEFFDSGAYYSAISYLWMSGEVFEEASTTPIRGVLECRYYGNGYIFAIFTLADEGVIQNYYDIACNILKTISFGNGWTTPDNSDSAVNWSDPGDSGNDPWSDPGDSDYDAWSDPGDSDYDAWSDPGDSDYDAWSDPGDSDYDAWSDPGDNYDGD